ncbi:hypothetical protein RTP6_003818 [Batrachochytrium dendrobatidis]
MGLIPPPPEEFKPIAMLMSFFFTVVFIGYAVVAGLRRKLLSILIDLPHPTDTYTAHDILRITQKQDFVFWHARGMEFAYLRLLSIKQISETLASIKTDSPDLLMTNVAEFMDMIDLIVSELTDRVSTADRVETVLKRIAYFKQMSKLSDATWVYMACLFATQPITWIQYGGFRQILLGFEAEAYTLIWRDISMRIGLKNIPTTYTDMQEYVNSFEKENAGESEHTARFAKCVIDASAQSASVMAGNSQIVKRLYPMAVSVYATESMRHVLHLPTPPAYGKVLLSTMMCATAVFVSYCLVPRKVPHMRTKDEVNTDGKYDVAYVMYGSGASVKGGYLIERVGPASMLSDDGMGKICDGIPKTVQVAITDNPEEVDKNAPKKLAEAEAST